MLKRLVQLLPRMPAFVHGVLVRVVCCALFIGAQHTSLAAEFEPDPALLMALKKSVSESDSFDDRFEAEVWLMSRAQPLKRFIKDAEERLTVLRLIHAEATRADLPPDLVLALIQVESAFNPYAVSRVGAMGMMQIMPFWKKEIGREQDNLINMETNLRYGCTILKYYLDREEGRWPEALARYNGSYGKYWYPERVMNAWEKYWRK